MKKNVTIGLIAAVAASAFALGASAQQRPAQPAQQQPAAAAPQQPPAAVKVPLKAAPYQPDWIKVCDEDPVAKKTVCYTTRDFVAENNQPVMGLAIYQVKDDPRRFARILVPLTFMIPPGVRLSTEGLNPVSGRFQICSQEGCFVEIELNDAAVNLVKKGKVLRLDMQNQFAQEVNFEVPLDGFSKMYDSAGLDPATLQKMREDAARQQQGAQQPGSDDLRKRGEELMRQRQGAQPPKP